MHFVKKYAILLIIIFSFTTVLAQSNLNAQTVEFSVLFSPTSLVIVVHNNPNTQQQSVSLNDLGFSYLYNNELVNTKLSEYGGFESDINWVQPGTCIEIEILDNQEPLPRVCGNISTPAIVHPSDRFWFDADTNVFRPITFSNIFTDQQCVIRNSACMIRFEQNAVIANSGTIMSSGNSNSDPLLITSLSFENEGENTSLVLSANGHSVIVRKSDCATTVRPDDLPEHEITVFALCDETATNAEFFIHNPAGDAIEWVVWRVLPQGPVEATPVPNIDPNTITGNVSVVQSNVRIGPGIDFPPNLEIPFINEGTIIELTRQHINLDTRQLWYRGVIDNRTVWVFANNVTIIGDNQGNNLPFVNFDEIPISPQLPDGDGDGAPDIEDVCPNNAEASRRSECPSEPSGITNNVRVVNPPTPSNQSGLCTLRVIPSIGVNVRTYPVYGDVRSGLLPTDPPQTVLGIMVDAPAPHPTWYRVSRGWVVGSEVNSSGDCYNLETAIYSPPPPSPTMIPTATLSQGPPPDNTSISPDGGTLEATTDGCRYMPHNEFFTTNVSWSGAGDTVIITYHEEGEPERTKERSGPSGQEEINGYHFIHNLTVSSGEATSIAFNCDQ